MDLLCARWIEPLRQSPRTVTSGSFAQGSFRASILAHLSSWLLPTDFARRLPPPTRRPILGQIAFTILEVLFDGPTPGRASHPISLALIGLLIEGQTSNTTRPPRVTQRSSSPCRPQTPWYGRGESNAFAFIVQARPCPAFGRPIRPWGGPHRLRPGDAPQTLRIPPRGGHPVLQRVTAGQRGITPAFGYQPGTTG